MLAVLVGQSASPDEIACLVFLSLENGLAHCKKLFGFEPSPIIEDEDDQITAYRWAIEATDEEKDAYGYDYAEDPNSIISKVANELIEDFDSSVFAFDLIEVEEGKPFVHWIT